MSKRPRKPEHVSQDDWDAVDSPELSAEFIGKMRPVREVAPELIAFQERLAAKRGRPKVESPKKLQSLRLSEKVIDFFKAQGPGWQTRINEALEKVVARSQSRSGVGGAEKARGPAPSASQRKPKRAP